MPKFSGNLTDDARRGWGRLMRRERTTLIGLIEAMGLALEDGTWDGPPAEVVQRAADVDAERHSR